MKYYLLFILPLIMACNDSQEESIVGTFEVIKLAEMEGLDLSSKNITISFSQDGKVNGNNSCNNFGGDYKLENDKLSFGMMRSTRMFCQENAEIETTFMRNLNEVDGYKIREDVLVLLREKKAIIKAKKVSNKE